MGHAYSSSKEVEIFRTLTSRVHNIKLFTVVIYGWINKLVCLPAKQKSPL
jgi:hypothetical protein